MTQRERILGGAVGLLVAGFLLYFVGGWFLGIFSWRADEIDRLTDQRDKLARSVRMGTAAREDLAAFEQRSLPGELEVAKTRYQDWLLGVAEREGLQRVVLTRGAEPAVKGVGNEVAYNFTAFGRLPQVVDFLHEIYRVNALHRVSTLRMQPTADLRYLKVTMTLQALWIDTNEGTRIPTEPGERLAFADVAAYQKAISDRNIFGYANKQPSLDAPSTTRVFVGERLNLEVKASDGDYMDELGFALAEGAPEGAEIVPGDVRRTSETGAVTRSARIGWSPPKVGTYEIAVTAFDDGLPSKPVTKTISVSVVERPPAVAAEPPPPRPEFDVARHTQFNAILTVDGVPEIWLFDRTAGKMHVLRIGDDFKIGSVTATVEEIGERTAVLRTKQGRLQISQGQFLTEAEELVSASQPEAF
ncbi:MAG TPA: hypothetical protein VGN57_15750 [Pirellulaceae bacterium]|jgi:hypothetical protein|nr:hypothetical protein [Pirellulaceae bacterium]